MIANGATSGQIRERLTDADLMWHEVTSSVSSYGTLAGGRRSFGFDQEPILVGRFLITVNGQAHGWLLPTAQALDHLLDLPSDWNSYGAAAIEPDHVAAALRLLGMAMNDDTPPPSVVPTETGSVQLEWHLGGVDLEIEVLSPQRFRVSFGDSARVEEWEREVTFNLDPLCTAIDRLW